jgi:hypothetical protein
MGLQLFLFHAFIISKLFVFVQNLTLVQFFYLTPILNVGIIALYSCLYYGFSDLSDFY